MLKMHFSKNLSSWSGSVGPGLRANYDSKYHFRNVSSNYFDSLDFFCCLCPVLDGG